MSSLRNKCYVKFGLQNKYYVELRKLSYVKLVRMIIR